MFGFRPDGRRIINKDPIVGFTPYLMPQRVDAQVHTMMQMDCDILTQYIRGQRDKGHLITYMDLLIAAYVRIVSQFPQLNRFIMNKQLYARSSICVSLTLIKTTGDDDDVQETAIKVHFDPYDTVYDVHQKMQDEIEKNRKPDNLNGADKTVRIVLAMPGVVTFFVAFVKLLDRYGLMPRFLVNISPFHTGVFVANMASIGMPYVNHHIYNFGTTSLFLAMGKVQRTPVPGPNNTVATKRTIPVGIVSDERITSGADYAKGMTLLQELLQNPSRLETPPESVVYEIPPEKMPRVPGAKKKIPVQG